MCYDAQGTTLYLPNLLHHHHHRHYHHHISVMELGHLLTRSGRT